MRKRLDDCWKDGLDSEQKNGWQQAPVEALLVFTTIIVSANGKAWRNYSANQKHQN